MLLYSTTISTVYTGFTTTARLSLSSITANVQVSQIHHSDELSHLYTLFNISISHFWEWRKRGLTL